MPSSALSSPIALAVLALLLAFSRFASAADDWSLLWDGKTFDGWHVIGKGEWKIIDGAIRGTHAKDEPEFGHLVTDRTYGDFTVRLIEIQ